MSEGSPHTPTPRLFGLLTWLHWRVMQARLRKARKESPLLIFILGAFISGYLYFGYLLFHAGLRYIYNFKGVGQLLADRILYLIFGFFFVMLVVSNLIIGYTTLFKNRETQWMLSLPIRHRDVYRWKFLEALVVASWALIFLSAPMLAAYGAVLQVPWQFYFKVALGYLPFLVIPAVAGSWIILFLVRVLSRRWTKRVFILLGIGLLLFIIFRIKPVSEDEAAGVQEVILFPKLMRGTRALTNPFLPSTWFAEAVKAWTAWGPEGFWQGPFNSLLLTSYALFGLLLAFDLAGRVYYGSWSAVLSSRAERYQRETEAKRQKLARPSFLGWLQARVRRLSPQMTALVFKDARVFWRDPAQWTQFMIFFGLLCIYVANLRNVAFEFNKQPYWETLISYLNLAASALTLSTLTTRFVFPMFSLEGRRVWILGLSPVGLKRVVLQKFWTSFLVSATITVTLMVASAFTLNLPMRRVAYFAVSICLMSAALSSLAVGLGALFPNFREENPSKIVSSFGGTLCLVMSFVYNTAVVALLAIPDLMHATKRPLFLPYWFTPAVALVLSVALIATPMILAIRRVKNLEM